MPRAEDESASSTLLPPPLSVLVWGENRHEQIDPLIATRYPDGIHGAVRQGIERHLGQRAIVTTATLDEPEHGLTEERLSATDVVVWWGHAAHHEVADHVVERVHRNVLGGMGLVVLHSGHFSKIFQKLMGTSCSLHWGAEPDREVVWTIAPNHEIAAGVPNPIVIEQQEMYAEFFDVPAPDELIFISTFRGGEVFRSGCTWRRGHGKIFYSSPGDQEYPVYFHDDVRRVVANGVMWAKPSRANRTAPQLRRIESGAFSPVSGEDGDTFAAQESQ